jgi:hypothetical protein
VMLSIPGNDMPQKPPTTVLQHLCLLGSSTICLDFCAIGSCERRTIGGEVGECQFLDMVLSLEFKL